MEKNHQSIDCFIRLKKEFFIFEINTFFEKIENERIFFIHFPVLSSIFFFT